MVNIDLNLLIKYTNCYLLQCTEFIFPFFPKETFQIWIFYIFITYRPIYKDHILMLLLDKNLGIGGSIKLTTNDSWAVKVFCTFVYSRTK